MKVKPDQFEALELQASIQIQRGKTHVGKRLIENLLKKSPAQKKRLHVLLGDIARSEGDWQGALGHYRHAASGAKSAEELERLTQRARELQQQRRIDILVSDEASYPEKFTAVRELSKTDEPKVVAAMVSLLDDSNLRLARFVWKALQEITGEDIGFSKAKWQAWVDANN